jgi:biotin-dependent carboxylase-like uncharacterized protein
MIKILKKGLHTSIQDLGRFGYRNYGIPVSGVMDCESAKLSNLFLGNKENDAVMEITLQGPQLQFFNSTQIAITGADLSPTVNGSSVEMNKNIAIQKGDIIDFGVRKFGVRSYLSISGGFQTELVFESRSFYDGITEKEKIEAGDEIPFNMSPSRHCSYIVQLSFQSRFFNKKEILVQQGPEYEMLNEQQKQLLFSTTFTLGMNNRMAYQLKEPLSNNLPSILSSAVLPGTVQLTPSGKIIILMRDCQTTGGYPRILQLPEKSINLLAQKMQHEKVKFTL